MGRAVKALFLLGCFVFLALHALGLVYRWAPVPVTANMALRPDGTDLHYRWTPIERVSPHLIRAVIAAEDSRFCVHDGLDFAAIRNAVNDNASGGRRRGGSTISQQTAKNVYLWNGGGYARKAVETWMSLYSDAIWGKRRVMEVYLNVAEWGDGIYGAEAAAWARFSKSAIDLSPREAALAAAVLPSPNKWRLDPPGPYVTRRAATIEARAKIVARDGLAACALD